jgi:hypothetical protein
MKLLVCSFHNAPDLKTTFSISVSLVSIMGTSCLHLLRNFIFSRKKEEEFKVFQQDDDDDDDDVPLHIRNFVQSSLSRYFEAS